MNKVFFAITAFALLLSCSPENKNENGENESDDLAVTGDVLEVTDRFATLTGYANLPMELGDAEVGIMYDKNQVFESAEKVVATGLDSKNKFTVTVTGLEASTKYYYRSYVMKGMAVKCGEVKSFTTKESRMPAGAVDLGLSVYWGTTNIGASKPEDYGDYYAWGETETKSDYSWSTYKWGKSTTSLTKYNTSSSNGTVDKKTFLDSEDDVAHVKLGGNWRMPTYEEWIALLTQCTWDYTTRNGVKGYFVTAPNGNSIFLPASGNRPNTSLSDDGSGGYYLSSSLDTNYPYRAWALSWSQSYTMVLGWYSVPRWYGHTVRPVAE